MKQVEKTVSCEQQEEAIWSRGLTWKSIVTSCIAILGFGYLINLGDFAHVLPTINADFMPILPGIAVLCVLLIMNVISKKVVRIVAFTPGELSIIYTMVSVGTMIIGLGLIGSFGLVGGRISFMLMREPDKWGPGIGQISRLLLPEADSTWDLWLGGVDTVPWSAWITPLIMYFIFFAAFVFIFVAIGAVFCLKWSDEERLQYPMVSVIGQMVQTDSAQTFWSNRVMWIGAAISFILMGSEVLHSVFPAVPVLVSARAIGEFLPEGVIKQGLNAWPGLIFIFSPITIGIAYLIPLDVNFSLWISWLAAKVFTIFGYATGQPEMPVTFMRSHTYGVWVGLAMYLVWMNRRMIVQTLKSTIPGESIASEKLPMSPRLLVIGTLISLAIVIGFFSQLVGVSLWAILVFLVLFVAASISFSRARSQIGVPANVAVPDKIPNVLADTLGSNLVGSKNLAGIGILWGVTDLPSIPAFLLEGYHLADVARVKRSTVTKAVGLAYVVAFIFGWYTFLKIAYSLGAGGMDNYRTSISSWGTDHMFVLEYPAQRARQWSFVIGMAMSAILMTLQGRFIWWPLHPVGYGLGWQYDIAYRFWGPFFVAWLVKLFLLRYGGAAVYNKMKPLFLGLVIGGVTMQILGVIMQLVF